MSPWAQRAKAEAEARGTLTHRPIDFTLGDKVAEDNHLPACAPVFGEWCLHCGTDTCLHASRHNAAISGERS